MKRTFGLGAHPGFWSLAVATVCAVSGLAGCSSSGDGDGDEDGGTGATNGTAGTGTGGTRSGSGGKGNTAGSGGSAGTEGFACGTTADPGALVEVEAGEFIMGCNEEVDDQCSDDEKPMHVVTLSAFEIDRTEVTQAQYTACVLDGACNEPTCEWDCEKSDYPASCVDFISAQAFCAWADKRLPTEAEWEKAARGSDGLKYPWGNDEPDCSLANFAECGGQSMAAGSLPDGESPYGALDMAGNMVEMTADYYDPAYYASSPEADPTGPASGNRYAGRGGGYRSDPEWQRASKRDWYEPSDTAASLGFRCAR
jgi:formylglycine-generating enzyme required for sulfatase activity